MKIGIDISQTAHEKTGVAQYLINLIENLSKIDKENEYVLFYSSLRKSIPKLNLSKNFTIKKFKFPPSLLNILWNNLHIIPIETFIGKVDIFISSDWVQPPTLKSTKNATVLYDLIVYRYPQETHDKTKLRKNLNLSANIVNIQKKRLYWVKQECEKIMCISEATKKDAMNILHIPEDRLEVVYPGI